MLKSLRWPSGALLLILSVSASDLDDMEAEMENEHLAVHGSGVPHPQGCSDSAGWENSCDINLTDYSIIQEADWSPVCDPWKYSTPANGEPPAEGWPEPHADLTTTWTHDAWTCPAEYQSVSGCGDFVTDTRNVECAATYNFSSKCTASSRPSGSDRRVIEVSEPLLPQKHVCVQRPIFYDNMNTAGSVTPPALGRHRERWAAWGEYEFLPPQRWLHNAEHGGLVFLYDPCLDEQSLCEIRTFIQKWRRKLGPEEGSNLRFIMTPFKDLQSPMAIAVWGAVYFSKCFNEADMDMFIEEHYRQAWEDYWPDGPYNELLVDFEANAVACGAPAMSTAAEPTGWQQGNETALQEIIDAAVATAVEAAVATAVEAAVKRECLRGEDGLPPPPPRHGGGFRAQQSAMLTSPMEMEQPKATVGISEVWYWVGGLTAVMLACIAGLLCFAVCVQPLVQATQEKYTPAVNV